MNEKTEAAALIESTLREMELLDWAEAASFVEPREEIATGAAGTRFRIKASAFWDVGERQSDFYLKVRVYPLRGPRKRIGYGGTSGPLGEPLPEAPPSAGADV
jgi:hypothetical protein